jgi:aldehyde:ferredoxin oxidoreductase
MATGGTVGWLFECYNEGVISKEELDGIDLTWGNADGMVAITEKICTNEGCGKMFINGSRRAAETLNKGFDFLTDASGIEVPQHDARLAPCLARTYQYDPAPGRHVQPGIGTSFANEPPEVRYNYHGTGFRDLVATAEGSILNSSGICLIGHLLSINILHLQREMLNAALGFNYSLVDYHHLGQRIFTIRQAFNLREGLRRKDFKLTKRMLGGLTAGPLEGVTVDNELLTDNLYNALGWDMDGVPSKEALELLGGLDFVKDDLEASEQSEENAA